MVALIKENLQESFQTFRLYIQFFNVLNSLQNATDNNLAMIWMKIFCLLFEAQLFFLSLFQAKIQKNTAAFLLYTYMYNYFCQDITQFRNTVAFLLYVMQIIELLLSRHNTALSQIRTDKEN